MARQPDIQYVRFYTSGTAAQKIEPQARPSRSGIQTQPQARPQSRRDARKVIRLDPLALCAMVVAGMMLIAMAIGMINLGSTLADADRMERYVSRLQAENAQLQAEHEATRSEAEENALEMGYVPVEQVQQVQIQVEHPEPAPAPSAWENFKLFLAELFA